MKTLNRALMKGHFNKPILVIMTSLVLILGTFALVLPYQEAEAAPPRPCPPNIVGGPTVNENIVVKAGVTCDILNGAIINGNIRIGKGADFFCEDSTINGNVVARGANFVGFENCTVTGKVSVVNTGVVLLDDGTTVGGDLTLRGNDSIEVTDTTIEGKAVCARNTTVVPTLNLNTYNGGNNGCPQFENG